MKIELRRSITFNGTEYKELELDLDKLTGADLIAAEDNLRAKGVMINGAADFSRSYLLAVCSQALKIPPEALKDLNAKDFTRLMNETLIFLAGTDSALEAESQTEKDLPRKGR